MALNPIQKSQTDFLLRGGAYELPLMQLREKGLIPDVGAYIHQDYPKSLNLSLGVREVPMQTEDHKSRTLTWTEQREAIAAAADDLKRIPPALGDRATLAWTNRP